MTFKALSIATAFFAATTASAQTLEFYLINESSADVVAFHVSTSSSDSWEENLISGGYLAPGYEIGVQIADGQTTCVYDIMAEFSDGATLEDYDLDLCDMGSYTFTD